MRRRRDTDYHRYGPGNAAPRETWPAYPAGSTDPWDPLAATRDANLTGPAARASTVRPTDAPPHSLPRAAPSGPGDVTPGRSAVEPGPTPPGDNGPAGFWRTARWAVALGAVVGAIYLATCAGVGLTVDDVALFLPAGFGFLLLVPATVLIVVAWVVRQGRSRGRPQAPSRALRGWTRAYGLLLGFMVAAFVWAGSSG